MADRTAQAAGPLRSDRLCRFMYRAHHLGRLTGAEPPEGAHHAKDLKIHSKLSKQAPVPQ